MGRHFQGLVKVKVLRVDDHELTDTHISHGTGSSPYIFRISGLMQHNCDVVRIYSTGH
jgi:hypothetical protein